MPDQIKKTSPTWHSAQLRLRALVGVAVAKEDGNNSKKAEDESAHQHRRNEDRRPWRKRHCGEAFDEWGTLKTATQSSEESTGTNSDDDDNGNSVSILREVPSAVSVRISISPRRKAVSRVLVVSHVLK
jgi:hypothetical protein